MEETMNERFDDQGRWIIPLSRFDKDEPIEKQRCVADKAYCANGHNLIDKDHLINGFPGIRLKFKRPGQEGEFVLSAVEGDFDKVMLSGSLAEGEKDDLYCPFCEAKLPSLVNCECKPGAELVVLGLTPNLDFNNALAFCNVTGCKNGTTIRSGKIITHFRLNAL
jgi:hypothetical protein